MPIALTKAEWSRILKWKDLGEDPEMVRRREYIKYLSETSKEITKRWPNSLENVNKRNEEQRRARIQAAEEANTRFYKLYVKNKQEEQKRLMRTARETVFLNKDSPKMLLSAVIETTVQKERQEQMKFKKEAQQKALDQKRREDEDIIQKAKEWHKLMALRRKRRFDVNKKHQIEILDQAREVSERNQMEHETELKLQMIDNVKANEQMEAIKEFEEEFKAAEKARILRDMKRAKEESDRRRLEARARDTLDDKLIEVLQRSRKRIDNKRKLTEKQIQKERLEVLQKISEKLESGEATRDAREQQMLMKAVAEKEAVLEAERLAQTRKQEQLKQQRIEERRRWLAADEQRTADRHTMGQWEIMNRFKNAELFEAFQQKLREDKAIKTQQHKEDLLKLWRERSERESRERAEIRHFYGERAEAELREGHRALLAHAESLLREAESCGRPDFPIRQAIDYYKKLNRLYPLPPVPPRAAPRASPRAAHRRAGLRAQSEATKKDEKCEKVEDYKRAAPANGLQVNPEREIRVLLPAVTLRK